MCQVLRLCSRYKGEMSLNQMLPNKNASESEIYMGEGANTWPSIKNIKHRSGQDGGGMPMILAFRIESMMLDWANDTLFPSTLQNKQISKQKQNSLTRKTLEGQGVRLKSTYGEV